jgi:hypothetical protein
MDILLKSVIVAVRYLIFLIVFQYAKVAMQKANEVLDMLLAGTKKK